MRHRGKLPEVTLHGRLMGLRIGDPCPNCDLGKGLRASSAIELGLTGWEEYTFLHCPICGITYVGRAGLFDVCKVEPFRVDE